MKQAWLPPYSVSHEASVATTLLKKRFYSCPHIAVVSINDYAIVSINDYAVAVALVLFAATDQRTPN
jgi:hypothetical protein